MGRLISRFVALITLVIAAAAFGADADTKPRAAVPAAAATAPSDYVAALKRDPNNADLWVAYGDAVYAAAADSEQMRQAAGAWQEARRLDPQHKTALRRLLDYYHGIADLGGAGVEVFDRLREMAVALAAADPGPTADDARAIMPAATVRKWLSGGDVDAPALDAAMAELAEWQRKRPDDADLPLFLAQAKLTQADAARRQNAQRGAAGANAKADAAAPAAAAAADIERLLAEGHAIMDAALAARPSARMYFSAGAVNQTRERMEYGGPPAAWQRWRDRKVQMYRKAVELVRDDDPLYVYIHLQTARAVVSTDPQAALKMLRALYERRPNDQEVRLELAEQLALNKSSRPEAIAILSQPFSSAGLRGPKILVARELRTRTFSSLANLKIEALREAAPDQRAKLRADAEESLNNLMLQSGTDGRYLRLLGKLQHLDGQTVEAIQTLEKARAWYEAKSPRELDRWDVIDLLAKSYIEANQLGQAKRLLRELIDHFPGYDPARMMLAQILIKDGSYDAARPHVEYFKRKDPNNPEVIKMDLQLSLPSNAPSAAGASEPFVPPPVPPPVQ